MQWRESSTVSNSRVFDEKITGYHINFGGRHSGTNGVVKKIIFKTSSEIFVKSSEIFADV